jgi:hypothetical protein
MKIINPENSYTFSKYFEMGISVQDLAEEFGYQFSRKRLNLSQYQGELDDLNKLQERLNEVLPYFDLANETSRQVVLISPLILELVHYTKSEVRIEYQIKVNDQLQGYLDYLLTNKHSLLVIEAKKQDLDFGFTQLSSELIALDEWEKIGDQEVLIGAVTTGNIWQFGRLNRREKHIEQGLDLYRVPDDLNSLMRILVQVLLS